MTARGLLWQSNMKLESNVLSRNDRRTWRGVLAAVCSVAVVASLATPRTASATPEVPAPLKGLREMRDRIFKQFDELHAKSEAGELTSHDVLFARIDVVSYVTSIHRGGTNAGECPECKKHPLFAELKAAFPEMEKRMEKLEHEQGCTFGYQMKDGKILTLTTAWSHDEWMEIMEKSKHKQGRCWMDKDKDAYL
jgi:hypothetical protein